ncbi:MAG: hypothetical protein JWO37_3370 [Acidimicrobiales bacterium]|nr:hypothetical protein [Acidimicrobiales bacterium]
MRKLITAIVVGVGVVGMGAAAFATPAPLPGGIGTYETGPGARPCATGETPPCATPADPSAADANLLPAGPVFVGQDGSAQSQAGHVAVAIGTEDNGVGRVSFGGSAASGAQLYAEDYTPGNAIAGGVSAVDAATGCHIGGPGCGSSTSDAILVTITG